MNKFVCGICLLAIGLFMGDAYALNAPAMQGGNPETWYIEVEYNTGALTASSSADNVSHGDVLEWDLEADTGETLGYTVHKCDSAAPVHVAGVVPADGDPMSFNTKITDGDVFMMQIYGRHADVASTTDVAEGDTISAGANGVVDDDDGMGFALGAAVTDATNSNSGTAAECWLSIGYDAE